MAPEPSIDIDKHAVPRAVIKQFVRDLGFDPNDVFRMNFEPHRVRIEYYRRDETGERYTVGEYIATALLDYKIVD